MHLCFLWCWYLSYNSPMRTHSPKYLFYFCPPPKEKTPICRWVSHNPTTIEPPLRCNHLTSLNIRFLAKHCYSYSKGGGSRVNWMSPTQKHPCPNSEKILWRGQGPKNKKSLQSHPAQVTRQNSMKILQLDQNMAPFFEKKSKRTQKSGNWCI